MKLKGLKKSELDVLGGESKQFSVDTQDSMIIRLLRDKMYKNKIAAVCREIASNARDANREAGRGDKPIKIKIADEGSDILSDDELTISFQDNGIGIAPDRMEKIFLKYGGSTKRDSDKFTGGFGIGAKTPFAYTDNFFIITVCDVDGKRMKYYYQAAITGDGKTESSQMVSLGEEETTEPTGTTIQIPIATKDVVEFEKETIYATSFWKAQPELIGFNRKHTVDVVHKGKANFTVIKDDNNVYGESTQYIALIDEIPYVLNVDKLVNTGIGNTRRHYYNYNQDRFVTLFHFDTSEITVSGSREDVEYIEENLNQFKVANKSMQDEIKQNILNYFEKSTSYYDRCVRANKIDGTIINEEDNDFVKLMSKLAKNLNISKEVIYGKYKGEDVVKSHSYNAHEFKRMSIQGGKMKTSGYLNGSAYGRKDWDIPMYYLDLSKAEPTRNAMLKKLHSDTGYIVISPKKIENGDVNGERAKEHDLKCFKLIGIDKKMKKYSEVEKLRKVSDSKRNITDLVKVSSRFLFNPNSWNRDWRSIKPTFDKKEKEFTDLLDIAQKKQPNTKKIAYFEVEKLSDLDGTGYSQAPGMSGDEMAMFQLLRKSGVFIIAISTSKAKYFRQAKIKSMKEEFVKLVENDKKGDKLLAKYIGFQFATKHKANSIYFELSFGKEKDAKLNELKKLMKFVQNNQEKLKPFANALNGVSREFINKVGIKIEIKDAVDTLVEIQNENPLINFYVDKTRLDKPEEYKKAKEQLIKLFDKANN